MKIKSMMFGLMIISSFVMSLSFFHEDVNSTSLNPKDFAYGYQLKPSQPASLYAVDLPQDFYLYSSYPDHRDFRVFNNNNKVIPSVIMNPPTTPPVIEQNLIYFPIEESKQHATAEELIQIQKNYTEEMSITTIKTQNKAQPNTGAYIIDLKQNNLSLRSLIFDWQINSSNQIIYPTIQTSKDLRNWTDVPTSNILANFSYQNQALLQNRLDFSAPINDQYIKLTWKPNAIFNVRHIKGEFSDPKNIINRQATEFQGVVLDSQVNEIQYDTKGYFPIDKINFKIPNNTFLSVRLFSRNNPNDQWAPVFNGNIYHLQVQGQNVVSLPIEVNAKFHRYWLLIANGKDVDFRGLDIVMQGLWIPQKLVFLAQGDEPFMLAFGNSAVKAADFGFNPNIHDVVAASLVGPLITLGGPDKTAPYKQPFFPFTLKQWLLWGCIALAVFFLAWLAMRLYREVKSG